MTPAPALLELPPPRRRKTKPTTDELTTRRLEVLVRLHRRDLDGAGAELLDALDTRRDELAVILGIASSELPHPGGREQLPALVALIDARLVAMKGGVAECRLTEARRLAGRLADESVHGFDGIELEQRLLAELAAVPGFDVVAFTVGEQVLGLGRCFITALLREVSNVKLTSLRIVAEESSLRVGYTGAQTHGWFRLRLEPPDVRRVCVVVDLDAVRNRPCAEDEYANSSSPTCPDAPPSGPFAALHGTAP